MGAPCSSAASGRRSKINEQDIPPSSIDKFTFKEKKAGGVNGEKVEVSSDSAADFLDIVFCIDTTQSMDPFIEKSKKIIKNMMDFFQLNEEKPWFGVVAYKDHPPQDYAYITKIHNLSNGEKALKFVNSLASGGGGDLCEAVLQGLYDSANKIKWRNLNIPNKVYKKLIIHVADAPPHGNFFHDTSVSDHWPKGCPSGITIEELSNSMNEKMIYYHFCRLDAATDIMCERFFQTFKNFELLDLVVNKENVEEQKKELEVYVAEHHVDATQMKKLESMDSDEQNECMYETKVTNMLSRKMKKK